MVRSVGLHLKVAGTQVAKKAWFHAQQVYCARPLENAEKNDLSVQKKFRRWGTHGTFAGADYKIADDPILCNFLIFRHRSDTASILQGFRQYFESLYDTRILYVDSDFQQFLQHASLPKIEERVRALNAPWRNCSRHSEFLNNKTPGNDSLPRKIYLKYGEL